MTEQVRGTGERSSPQRASNMPPKGEHPPLVVDAQGMVIGRLATRLAKKVLAGEEVIVINAEKCVVVGRREDVYADYFEKFNRGDWHGPWIPRMPDQILRRVVRGMLPYKNARGRNAWRRLQAYIGVPRGIDATKALRIEDAIPSGSHPFVPLEDVSRYLGAHWRDAPAILPRQRVAPEEKARRKEETRAAIEERRKAAAKAEREDVKKEPAAKAEAKPAEKKVEEKKEEKKPAAQVAKATEKKEAAPAKKAEPKPESKPAPKAEKGEKPASHDKKVK